MWKERKSEANFSPQYFFSKKYCQALPWILQLALNHIFKGWIEGNYFSVVSLVYRDEWEEMKRKQQAEWKKENTRQNKAFPLAAYAPAQQHRVCKFSMSSSLWSTYVIDNCTAVPPIYLCLSLSLSLSSCHLDDLHPNMKALNKPKFDPHHGLCPTQLSYFDLSKETCQRFP